MYKKPAAARTNLTSTRVQIHEDEYIGHGSFRTVCRGTYLNGNRNGQAAVCKRFHKRYRDTEYERVLFDKDELITAKAIDMASEWNNFCPKGREITINCGYQVEHTSYHGEAVTFLVEPLIRDFVKYTSNNGWINRGATSAMEIKVAEAFCHYTYHRSGGSLIVADIQGRFKKKSGGGRTGQYSRFEYTDLAICSRNRHYGPSDMGAKGIESFFANHVCNEFCSQSGRWSAPRDPQSWFDADPSTSMMSSDMDVYLGLRTNARFRNVGGMLQIDEGDENSDY